MRLFYLLFIFSFTLFGASIDTKLYEDKDKASYYDAIQKQIDTSVTQNLKDEKLIQEELIQLFRVREASEQKISLEEYSLKKFESKTIAIEVYYDALKQLASLQ